MRVPLLLVTLVISCSAGAQGNTEIAVKPVKAVAPPYATISYLTQGPAYGFTDGAVRGQFHRVLFIEAGLTYDLPVIRLESLTYGDEGCCMRLAAAWELKLDDLQSKGIRLPHSASTEVRFLKWTSSQAFDLKVGHLTCSITDVGQSKVRVACDE